MTETTAEFVQQQRMLAAEKANQTRDFSMEYLNRSDEYLTISREFVENKGFQIAFCFFYMMIFMLGLTGNMLVVYVVVRNKAMHTVTNLFITNLALSDILLCVLAVPFTPLYTFTGHWAFGDVMCHLVPFAQGTSVYVSTLTLTAIAVDRFFVIIYPFRPRMKLSTCIIIIVLVWTLSIIITLPYCVYMFQKPINGTYYCEEQWPMDYAGMIYGAATVIFQFVIPFFVIAFCYIRVSLKLNDRARSKPGSKNTRKEEADRERKRRTNRMLIAMVAIFGLCWSPLNGINLMNDLYPLTGHWQFYYLTFFLAHTLAMSSTCYNPFLYAWLNDNFRKEFKQVLPCYQGYRPFSQLQGGRNRRSERTCNGNETCQETLLPTSSIVVTNSRQTEMSSLDMMLLTDDSLSTKKILDGPKCRTWTGKTHDSVEIMLVSFPTNEEKANNVSHLTNNALPQTILEDCNQRV